VAGSTRRGSGRHVCAHKREAGGTVIKLAVGPGGDGVAGSTGRSAGRKSRRNVIGNIAADRGGLVPVLQMAAHAIRRLQRVVIADVAGSAGGRSGRHMRADQSEAGHAVVERSGIPALRGVAIRAIRESKSRACGGVHRIVGVLPGG
jgi:hypothetical protein